HISSACSCGLHRRCLWRSCVCYCHLTCARCGGLCREMFNASQVIGTPRLVCGACYVIVLHEVSHRSCELWGDEQAYQEPEVSSAYLCVGCHHGDEEIRLNRRAG